MSFRSLITLFELVLKSSNVVFDGIDELRLVLGDGTYRDRIGEVRKAEAENKRTYLESWVERKEH